MLKKITFTILEIVFSFSLLACHKDTNRSPLENMYKVTELEYTKNETKMKFKIKYPEVSGLSDINKQKKINLILKDEALKVLNYYEGSEGFL